MFLTRSEYDRGVNTFSPEGRLFQVEYAMEAVKLGTTTIGIHAKEGIILAAERRTVSRLVVEDSIRKVSKIDKHIVAASAGLIADARTWVERARTESQNYLFTYGKKIRVEDITLKISELALHFGDDDSTIRLGRPFGVAMLFAGVDHTGPHLFHLDPSGTYIKCLAKAIGAGGDGAEQVLKEQCLNSDKNMTLAEARQLALTTLKQLMEEKISSKNVEVVLITPMTDKDEKMTGKVSWLTEPELAEAIATLQ